MKKIALFVLLAFCSLVRAEYYCMFFATDSVNPKHCHVWGTFVHAKDGKLHKEVTISWNPEKNWNILDRPRTGMNMTLKDSMELSGKKNTLVWGPYSIDETLFSKAISQYESTGKYKMVDGMRRPEAVNCIHRLTDITGVRAKTYFRYGKFAGTAVQKHYDKLGLLAPVEDGEKVVKLLGLDEYKLKLK